MRCLLLLLLALPAQAKIDRVVVFGDRAQVTRTAKASCRQGEAKLRFFPLPLSLDPRTVRAEASGRAKAIGTVISKAPVELDRDARLSLARQALEASEHALQALNDRIGELDSHVGRLQGLEGHLLAGLREQLRDARSPAGVRSGWDGLRAQRLSAVEEQVALRAEVAKKTREVVRHRQLVSRLSPTKGALAYAVDVAVDCKGEGAPTLSLAYVVPGATWAPEYDLRFESKGLVGKGRVALTVSAVVQQSTGEDWEEAKLVLSSARPWLGVSPPQLAPIRVRGHKGSEVKVLVEGTERRDSLRAGSGGQGQGPRSAALEHKGQSVTLSLPRRVTVRSDGRPYWMPVDVVKGKGRSKLVAVPKLRAFVFHALEFDNPAPYPLLAGRVHTWRKGTFVGDQRLTHKGPGEPVELSLGVDEAFRVEREPIRELNRSPGVFRSTRKLERRYRLKVKNSAARTATVELREHIPVSQVEAVKVSLDEGTTKGYEHDEARGYVRWPVKLKAGQERTLKLYYTIGVPEDWKLRVQ